MKPWTEKHKPKSLREVQAQDRALAELKQFVLDKVGKKSALIYGPTGCGKTCSVYALAQDLNYEILEINASDFRNKDQINTIVGSSAKQQSLFGKGKIILVDEIDGLSGKEDRGGVQALARILKESFWPIILTAIDPWDAKLSILRSKSEMIEFNSLNYLSILKVLKKICKNEKVKFKDVDLKSIARMVGGDLRAAINDLQSLTEHKKILKKEDLEILGEREQKESIFNALKLIFKSKKPEIVLDAFNKTNLNLDEAFLWLEENIAREYRGKDLEKAYDVLAKSDVFNGRIKKSQNYRFLVYRNVLMTAGIALAKKEKHEGFTSYKRTSRILKLWIAKQKALKKMAIAEKIAKKTHSSTKKILQDTLPYLKIIFQKNKGKEICRELNLSEEETEWLSKI